LKAARAAASERFSQFDAQHAAAIEQRTILDGKLDALQRRLRDSEGDLAGQEREWRSRHDDQRARALASRAQKGRFPARWIAADAVQALYEKYSNAKQAELRMASVENELETGQWEKDGTVEDKHLIMQGTVGNQRNELDSRKISNHQAEEAVGNARERYIDVLRATVRRYRKNIVDLGALAGVVVSADLPHLDNDDTILRQAELKVSFNFDGKGEIGLNDGEASGGQQVIKSLILLVGLLKDDDMPGGFVFIDEPFAHLDVRNIQLVGNFLKSTRAQYVLTTPITHNVEVFSRPISPWSLRRNRAKPAGPRPSRVAAALAAGCLRAVGLQGARKKPAMPAFFSAIRAPCAGGSSAGRRPALPLPATGAPRIRTSECRAPGPAARRIAARKGTFREEFADRAMTDFHATDEPLCVIGRTPYQEGERGGVGGDFVTGDHVSALNRH
jgi:hypothetical protein